MANLHIIGAGGMEFGGLGMIYRKTVPTAFTGAGGMVFAGTGVVAMTTPGVVVIVGNGGLVFGGEGVIAITRPLILAVTGSGGIVWGGRGLIESGATITAHVGSGGMQFGGQGALAITYPVAVSILAVIGSGGLVFGGAGVVEVVKPSVLAIIGSGGMQFGEFRVPELTVLGIIYPADLTTSVAGAGGIEFGGTGAITWSRPLIYAVPSRQAVVEADFCFGGSGIIAFIHPQILEVIGAGGILFGGEPVGQDLFETYALTGAQSEPSIYSGFNFNSYAKFRNQYYGAGENGVYLLEGEDDAGAKIHAGIKIGPVNLGTDREKRLRLIRCGGKTDGAQVKVSNDIGFAGYYDVEGGRAGVSRDVQGREITIEIMDFMTLDHLEIVPLILSKR